MRKRICVIDGQGGAIGAAIIRNIRMTLGEAVELTALGTDAVATISMLKAGAHQGASGENSILHALEGADCIVAPVSVTWANAMMGEVSPRMAQAVMESPAWKILIPMSQEKVVIVGVRNEPLPHLVQMAVAEIMQKITHKNSA